MEKTLKIEDLRRDYRLKSLDIAECNQDPILQFEKWFQEAVSSECHEPNAFILSTVDSSGKPRARTVLLKGIKDGGFYFYTNYESAKGAELSLLPFAALTFLWLPLERQVRIQGKVAKISFEESEAYFQSRPRGSQLGAIASQQSQKIQDKDFLKKSFEKAEKDFAGIDPIPCPTFWGGYKITPDYFEFWQGQSSRLHDRIEYVLDNNSWVRSRLSP